MFRTKNIIILLCFIIFSSFSLEMSNLSFHNIKVGDVSQRNYFAPKSITYKDEEQTKRLQKEALTKVQNVYISDENVEKNSIEQVEKFFSSLQTAKENVKKSNAGNPQSDNTLNNPLVSEQLKKVDSTFGFNVDEIYKLFLMDKETLNSLKDITLLEIQKVYEGKVGAEILETTQKNFRSNNAFYMFPKDIRDSYLKKIASSIHPNLFLNEKETKKLQNDAVKKVEPVMKAIKKGELIVGVGDVINEDQFDKLIQLELINGKNDFKKLFWNFPYVLSVFCILYVYLFTVKKEYFKNTKQYLFVLTGLFLMIQADYFLNDTFFVFVPFLTILMLFALFWGRNFVIFLSILSGLVISGGDFYQLALVILSGLFLALFFNPKGDLSDSVKSSMLVGIVLATLDSVIQFTFEDEFVIWKAIWLFISSLIAVALMFVISLICEKYIGLITPFSLSDLTKSNHPLLRQLQVNAPGTYDHSTKVAILSELGADEIGADGLLLRVAAYYHDVGKLKHPEFFIENSTIEDNPHKNLEPLESAKIILEHPWLSIRWCEKYNIPKPVIDLIASHHGNTTVEYFYAEAKKKDPNVDKELFRYKTPTPKTKEQGILMLADSTEAYSRAISRLEKEEFVQKIHEHIFKKINDGYLNDCELTMKDIKKIEEKFVTYLLKSNHQRIPYKVAKE